MTTFTALLCTFKTTTKGKHYLLGISGGVDSVVLFHLLTRAGVSFLAVHVDHGLRGAESDRDREFVKKLCADYEIPCEIIRTDLAMIAREKKQTLEEAGHHFRQQVFRDLRARSKAESVLLAHHQDDQVETILLNLLRGCGLHGLRGMQEVSEIFWRPMLSFSRAQILQYAKRHNLEWCEDSTNQSLHYTRNRLRHMILPALEKDTPGIRTDLLQLAEAQSWQAERLELYAKSWVTLHGLQFARGDFMKLATAERGEVLRALWIALHGSVRGFERVRATEVERLLIRNVGKKQVKFGKFWIALVGGRLEISAYGKKG